MFKRFLFSILALSSFCCAETEYGRWISVNEKIKPMHKQDVAVWIISVKQNIYVGKNPTLSTYYVPEDKFTGEDFGYKVLFWMPFPPDPTK